MSDLSEKQKLALTQLGIECLNTKKPNEDLDERIWNAFNWGTPVNNEYPAITA